VLAHNKKSACHLGKRFICVIRQYVYGSKINRL